MLATRRRRYIPKSKIYYLPVPGSSSITPTTLTRTVTVNGIQSEVAPSGTLWNRVDLDVRVPSGLPIALRSFFLGPSDTVSPTSQPLSDFSSISDPTALFSLQPLSTYLFIGESTLTLGSVTYPVLRFQLSRNFSSSSSSSTRFTDWSSCYYYKISTSQSTQTISAYVFASSYSSPNTSPPFVDLDLEPSNLSVSTDSAYLSSSYFSLDLS